MKLTDYRLGKFCEMKYGKMPPQNVIAEDGFPIFSGYRITGYAKEYLFNEPRVVVVARGVGGTGDVKISPEKSWITNLTIVLDHDPSIVDMRYLYYRLGREPLKDKLNTGAAQAQITIEALKSYPLPLPLLATQQRIASILSTYDDLIENNRRRIQLLEQAARLLYKEWFIHLRFPGHEHTKIINGVPEGWENTYFPEVIDVNPKTFVEKGRSILYVPMAALSESGMTVDLGQTEHRTDYTSVKFQKNDVLLARITPCLENGKTGLAYFLNDAAPACGSTEFIVMRGKRVSYAYTYCLVRSYPFRENAIKSMIGSSGRQRVQVSCFSEYNVLLPPKNLLAMFDEIAINSFDQIKILMAQNNQLTQARDLLLPRLMNGEIAV